MIDPYQVDMKDVYTYIREHPSYFRYLRMLGISVEEIGLPDKC
jgi:hypothetical protein